MKLIGKRPLTEAERASRRRAKLIRERRVFIEVDLAQETVAVIDSERKEGERRGLAVDRLINPRTRKPSGKPSGRHRP